MNYMAELNAFDDWVDENESLSPTARLLYIQLLQRCNKARWIQPFTVSLSRLAFKTGLSISGVQKARNQLKQYGLIDWKSRSGQQSAEYTITSLVGTEYQQTYQQQEQQQYQQVEQQPYQQPYHIERHKTKDINTTSNEVVYVEQPKDKPKVEKKKTTRKVFVKPTPLEIQSYVDEQNLQIDAERFYDYYEGNGWKIGRNPMKDWKATARNWSRRNEDNGGEYNKRTRVTTTNEPKTDEYADLYL